MRCTLPTARRVLLLCVAVAVVGPTGAHRWGTEEAILRLERINAEVAEQEKLVDALRHTVGTQSNKDPMTCSANDHACHRLRQSERRRMARKSGPVADMDEPVQFVSTLPLPSRMSALRWLPFRDTGTSGPAMNTLLVAADAKGLLHIMDKSGKTLLSVPSGHSAVTAMAVSTKHAHECTLITGGPHGEIRIHAISRPPRYALKPPLDVKGKRARRTHEWRPLVRLVSRFSLASAKPLDGLAPKHFRANLQGAKAIVSVAIVPRGVRNSYNILASDSTGRVAVHMKNGTLIASHQLESSTGIAEHAVSKTWVAVSVDKKLMVYEPRTRKLHAVSCSRFMRMREARLTDEEEDAQRFQEGDHGAKTGAPTRRKVAVDFDVNSLSIEESAAEGGGSSPHVLVGASDGRLLVIKIGFDKGVPTCNVQHDVAVAHGAEASSSPVNVLAVRGKMVAAVGSKTAASLNLYNSSKNPHRPPVLVQYVPLDTRASHPLQMHGDTAHGIALLANSKTAQLYYLDVPPQHQVADWWNLEYLLDNFRTPVRCMFAAQKYRLATIYSTLAQGLAHARALQGARMHLCALTACVSDLIPNVCQPNLQAMVIGLLIVLWFQLKRRGKSTKGGLNTLLNLAADRARGT